MTAIYEHYILWHRLSACFYFGPKQFSTPFEHKIKALYQTVSCLMIDGKRCRPLLNGCLIAEFGFQDFQRGQLQSVQLGYIPHCLS